eukprot:scaffold266831_cov33-Tisochrysis_lutea.AAC.1
MPCRQPQTQQEPLTNKSAIAPSAWTAQRTGTPHQDGARTASVVALDPQTHDISMLRQLGSCGRELMLTHDCEQGWGCRPLRADCSSVRATSRRCPRPPRAPLLPVGVHWFEDLE